MYYLAITIIILIVLVYFLNSRNNNDEEQFEDNTVNSPLDVTAVTKETSSEEVQSSMEDLEVVAAIMGALSTYIGVPASQLKIRSIKRADSNDSLWRKVGMLK